MASKTKNLEDEYMLTEVPKVVITDECFTPDSPPRVTQPTFAKYLIRKDGKSDYVNQKIEVHPTIVDRWADENRGYWVNKAGTNDYFIHEMHKKYTYKTTNYSPKNMPFKRLFPRPYACELDCLNALRLCGMQDIENRYRPAVTKLSRMAKEIQKEKICEFLPPFWWEQHKKHIHAIDPCEKVVPELEEEVKPEKHRWKPIPDIGKLRSICERRDEMNQY